MGAVLGDRVQAGFVNGFVNVCLISLVLIVLLRGFPSPALLKDAPWWAYLGGAIGAGVVMVQLTAAPVLGAGLLAGDGQLMVHVSLPCSSERRSPGPSDSMTSAICC